MMVKSARPGEGWGGALPSLFTLSTITSNVVVYAPLERADQIHSPPSSPLPLYALCGETARGIGRTEWKGRVESERSGNSGVRKRSGIKDRTERGLFLKNMPFWKIWVILKVPSGQIGSA